MQLSVLSFAYSATPKPRPSAKNIGIKIFLSPRTQTIFNASATNCIMNFANMYLLLT